MKSLLKKILKYFSKKNSTITVNVENSNSPTDSSINVKGTAVAAGAASAPFFNSIFPHQNNILGSVTGFYKDGCSIKNALLNAFNSAEKEIIIVVPWLTDDSIIQSLKNKKDISLDILISDESDNAKKNYNPLNVKVIKKFGKNDYNRLHAKFCIIDKKYVLCGSYNYTPTAYYNKEFLLKLEGDEIVKNFFSFYLELSKLDYFISN